MCDYDVAIIGGGLSGLTAAALLTRAGLSVCLAEEQPRPGGYLQGFSRRGFTFDSAVQWVNGASPDGMVGRLFSLLGDGDYPPCKPLDRTHRYRGDSFDYRLTADPDLLRDQLCEEFPHQAEGLRRLFADCQHLGGELRRLNRRMRAPETMGLWTKAGLGLKMLAWYWPLRRLIRSTREEGLRPYIDDPGLLRIFEADEKLIEVLAPIAWNYEKDTFSTPEGGCQRWISWLVGLLEAGGARLLLGEPVEAVLLDDRGRAAGLRCASGTEVQARWVVGACDVQRLYEQMLPEGVVPQKLLRKLREADLYYSNLTLFIGLSCDPRQLGLDEELLRLTRDDADQKQGASGDPEIGVVSLLAPSVRDATLAPEGKGTLTVHLQAWLDHHDTWKTGPNLARGAAYRALKEQQAERLLDRLEQQLLPGLRQHIELMEVATPVTYHRYTGNRAGSIMGASPTTRNIKAGLAHYRTPVKRLLLAGHWAEYGGGVPMVLKAAANVSLLILQKENPEAFAELRDRMDGSER